MVCESVDEERPACRQILVLGLRRILHMTRKVLLTMVVLAWAALEQLQSPSMSPLFPSCIFVKTGPEPAGVSSRTVELNSIYTQ